MPVYITASETLCTFCNNLPFILDFKFSPCSECCILSFGWFPGIRILCSDVSEHSVSSIFIGGWWNWQRSERSAHKIQTPRKSAKRKNTIYPFPVFVFPPISILSFNPRENQHTGLFKIIVGVLTTCHKQYTWDRSSCIFYLIEQHSKFLSPTLQVCNKNLEVCTCLACCTCSSVTDCLPVLFLLHTHPVSWNCAYNLQME